MEIDKELIKEAVREVLKEEKLSERLNASIVQLGDKWRDGSIFIMPGNKETKEKEIPIDTFFHKIVMIRDNLRVLEQKINSSTNLSDEEKVHIQQYITRCYGTLTTFNILFRDREDGFKGSGR